MKLRLIWIGSNSDAEFAGAIAGRALYDGRLDAVEALKLISTARMAT